MNLLWGNFMSYLYLMTDVIPQVLVIKSKRYFDVWEPFDGPENVAHPDPGGSYTFLAQ